MDGARRKADGSLELWSSSEGLVRRWTSVESWALEWRDEWRSQRFGPASELSTLLSDEPPADAVAMLVTLAELADGDRALLAYLGAGPIEDLVSHSGRGLETIDEVEAAARRSPAFRRALSCVWLAEDVPESVRQRLAVFGARDFVAERAMSPAERAAYLDRRRAAEQ